jgi:hypothetical protein
VDLLERSQWAVLEAAVDLIAAHYLIDRDLAWGAVIALEMEVEEHTGVANFGTLLDHPCGFTTLGIRVAEELLGEAAAAALPALYLSHH